MPKPSLVYWFCATSAVAKSVMWDEAAIGWKSRLLNTRVGARCSAAWLCSCPDAWPWAPQSGFVLAFPSPQPGCGHAWYAQKAFGYATASLQAPRPDSNVQRSASDVAYRSCGAVGIKKKKVVVRRLAGAASLQTAGPPWPPSHPCPAARSACVCH